MPPAKMLPLHRCAESDDLIRVKLTMRGLSEELLHLFADIWNSRGTTNQHYFIDVRGSETGVG